MAQYLSYEQCGTYSLTTAVPTGFKPTANAYQATLCRLRGSIQMQSQTTSDTINLGVLPAGSIFVLGFLNATALISTTTIAIGNSSDSTKYRAALTVSGTGDQPQTFGKCAPEIATTALTADETVIATIGAAALPASGNFVVDIFYSRP